MIYLDNAATSLIKPLSVARAVSQAINTLASPGRGGHRPAMQAAETVLDCRMAAAELFHVPSPEQVVFTMNATHGLNLAIRSLAGPDSKVLISGFEHNSVTRPLHALGAEILVAGRTLFDPQGALNEFQKQIGEADLVVCTHVSNAFGYILPIREIAELCRENSVPLIIDASQSAGVLPLDLEALGAAFIAMPGHKGLYGPQGTGLLLCGTEARPLLYGGSGSDSLSQEMPDYLPDRLEAGTPNVCGIAGLLAGLRYVREKGSDRILSQEQRLLGQMVSALQESSLQLFTGPSGTQSGVLSVRSESLDCETLAEKLAEAGICVRSGLHCAPLAHRSAGTLETGTVRFSFSPFVTEEQISYVCKILNTL